ncbi:MAG: hypothetical protein M3O09_12510 [Acidobacteriota bacterium]|nr:hypothetical protein [Acidobacteriota bacterium]
MSSASDCFALLDNASSCISIVPLQDFVPKAPQASSARVLGTSATIPRMAKITGVENIVAQLRTEKINLTNQLRHADAALSALAGLNGGGAVTIASRKGSRLSAAARRKISLAQKARWAKLRAGKNKKG